MMMRRFFQGFGFLKQGFAEVKTSKAMKALVIIPLLIDIVVFALALTYSLPLVPVLVATALGYLFSSPEGWLYNLVYYPLWIMFGLVFLVAVTAATYFLASILSSPFNALLAEEVLERAGAIPDRPFSMGRFIKTSTRMFWISLLRTAILVSVGLVLFVLSFLPGVNIATSFVAFMLVAFDASDFAMETMEYGLRDRIRFFRNCLAEYAGMGAAVGLVMLVPGVMILCMPFAVAGATLMVAERKKIDSRINA